eukprot:403362795
MGGTESSLKVIMQFSKIPEPVQVPQDNSNLREMLTEVKKAITENGSEGVALFINTYRNSMKILLQIMKHPNSQPETVMLGFDIVNILFEYDSALAAFLQYQGIEFLQKICTTYDFKTEGRVRKMSAAINLIIKIIKRDIKAAETIVSKGIISILTPLIMETEVQQSDTERIELIRSTAKVFAELTEIQNLDILKKMANETGIVANFVLLLNDFEDGPTLGYSLNTLGNLSILPNVQGNQFLIKNGVQNVLQILEEKEDKWIRLQACKTLRQLAATRNPELALKIKNLQTIDKLLKIIDQDQEEESGVNFYCKLSLLELCHSKENQEEIEQKGGIDHLLSLTYYQPKTTQERVLFANTILQFSYRSSWIKIPEVFPYFVRVVMKNLKESLTIKHKKNADTKKSFIERKSVSKIQKLSLKAIMNISLSSSSHKEIFQKDNLPVFILFLGKIYDLYNNEEKQENFTKKKGLKLLNVVKTITNCMITYEICQNIESKVLYNKKHIDELLEFMHTFHKQEKIEGQKLPKELKQFYVELQNECTLGLCLIERSSQSYVSQQNDEKKASFLLHLLKSDDTHLICKALNILGTLSSEWNVAQYLYKTKFIQLMRQMLDRNDPAITRELDSFKVGVNSADNDTVLVQQGNPKRLPKDRGIFRNWGAFFDFGDALEIPGGLNFQNGEWTISAWIILPITFDTGKRHTLAQGVDGRGAHFAIDETGSRLGSIDTQNNMFVDSGVDLGKYKKGWHNIIITCDNAVEMKITFFLDGKQTKESQTIINAKSIGYIGNAKSGNEPFGTVSDIRIYPYILKHSQIASQSKYHDELEYEMPDRYHLLYLEENIIDTLIERLKTDVESTIINIIRALSRLATKKECRSKILQCGGLETCMLFINNRSDEFKYELYKLMFNLQ